MPGQPRKRAKLAAQGAILPQWSGPMAKDAIDPAVRAAAIKRYLETGEVRRSATEFGLPPSTLQNWITRDPSLGGRKAQPQDIALRAQAGAIDDPDDISRMLGDVSLAALKRLRAQLNNREETIAVGVLKDIAIALIQTLHSRVDVSKVAGTLTATKTVTREQKIQRILEAVNGPVLETVTHTQTEALQANADRAAD